MGGGHSRVDNAPATLTLRDVLEFGTLAGAHATGMAHKIGSLSPGKQADLLLVRATDLNLAPVCDPVGAVVLAAHAGNIDSVFVAGRAVKRHGRLLGHDLDALRQRAAAWPDLDVSINLSPIQLTARGFLEDVDRLMLDFGARPQGITFEVTEGALMERQGGAFEVLAGLRARGFGIALDDFGTGYSSLSHLTSFHFDRLKIDRAFVRNIDCDLDAQAVLKAIVELGHTLQTRVVAEGVETLLQRQLVVAAGCDMIQGFYHWRPLVPENLADLLMQKRRGPGGVAVAEAADALADRAA